MKCINFGRMGESLSKIGAEPPGAVRNEFGCITNIVLYTNAPASHLEDLSLYRRAACHRRPPTRQGLSPSGGASCTGFHSASYTRSSPRIFRYRHHAFAAPAGVIGGDAFAPNRRLV